MRTSVLYKMWIGAIQSCILGSSFNFVKRGSMSARLQDYLFTDLGIIIGELVKYRVYFSIMKK